MKQFAVIGDPIAHSLSPLLHQEIYRQLDIDASFEKIQIKLEQMLHTPLNVEPNFIKDFLEVKNI